MASLLSRGVVRRGGLPRADVRPPPAVSPAGAPGVPREASPRRPPRRAIALAVAASVGALALLGLNLLSTHRGRPPPDPQSVLLDRAVGELRTGDPWAPAHRRAGVPGRVPGEDAGVFRVDAVSDGRGRGSAGREAGAPRGPVPPPRPTPPRPAPRRTRPSPGTRRSRPPGGGSGTRPRSSTRRPASRRTPPRASTPGGASSGFTPAPWPRTARGGRRLSSRSPFAGTSPPSARGPGRPSRHRTPWPGPCPASPPPGRAGSPSP